MAVSVSKGDGVTVLTVSTDSSSVWPPLCQILGGLCCNPSCCSLSPPLRRVQRSSQSLLGALHIMAGVLSIVLAVVLCLNGTNYWWYRDGTAFPFWLGGLFVSLGVFCVLSEKFPSPCLVVLNVVLQLSGVLFATAAIVLYSIDLATTDLWEFCENLGHGEYLDPQFFTTPAPSAQEGALLERCLEAKDTILALLVSINAVLVVLSVLELCLTISSSVLGIQSLRSIGRNRDKGSEDPESFQPLVPGLWAGTRSRQVSSRWSRDTRSWNPGPASRRSPARNPVQNPTVDL